jgi:DNA-binding HxlR family transcriptional regulator
MTKWTGYQRFCSLARGLDLIGDRWTLPLIQELLFEPARYNDLRRRLPGIGSNVLAERLRKLERHGIVHRSAKPIGQGVLYQLTPRGEGLAPALRELRKWGAGEHLMLDPRTPDSVSYDMSYAIPDKTPLAETYEWRVDDETFTLEVDGTVLTQRRGPARDPVLTVTTTRKWINQLLSGRTTWATGRSQGSVTVAGTEAAWQRMLAVTAQPGADPQILTQDLTATSNHAS